MTAHEQYLERRKLLNEAIEILRQKLEAMDIDEAKDQKNYGFYGNCGHVLETINELNYGFMERY